MVFASLGPCFFPLASLVAEVRTALPCGAQPSHCSPFSCCGAQTLGTWALLLCGMWDLLGPKIETVSPVLVGRFLTTGPASESPPVLLLFSLFHSKIALAI